ncbi:hypothetical protein [Kistimonas asteriae]|uniref:hypothetical protein n=1 Tax=Kistimonas asteriae TaxID=517724 RepID=UPI001BA77622|nr:hypothetical protein [Kistimonas asteriae]
MDKEPPIIELPVRSYNGTSPVALTMSLDKDGEPRYVLKTQQKNGETGLFDLEDLLRYIKTEMPELWENQP